MTDTSRGRIRLTHHIVELDDGRRVGLSVGGRGVPLVFMHALLLNRRAYLRMLSRIAGLGFLVVAVDAAGHGDTRRLPKDHCSFSDRADSVLRILDALGIGHAVFAGHSMGGRMTIQLAARAPERVLAAVLFDPAAGARFDATIPHLVKSPGKALGAASIAFRDTLAAPMRLETGAPVGYLRLLASAATPNLLNPLGAFRTIKAIIESGDYTPMLQTMSTSTAKVSSSQRTTIVCSPRGTSSPMTGDPGISAATSSPPEVCASASSSASSRPTADRSTWGATQSRLRRVPPLT
jgi:pimeloyl-ACP methyl ester carboxylesterase